MASRQEPKDNTRMETHHTMEDRAGPRGLRGLRAPMLTGRVKESLDAQRQIGPKAALKVYTRLQFHPG